MDNSTLQRIQEALNRSKNIAIAVGDNPTIDEMGSSLALFLSLQLMGKTVSVLAPTEPIVELSNLVGIDKVKTAFEGGGADLVVSFPYREGDIEKVSYTIENDYLNIVVKAGAEGLKFSENDVRYTRGNSGSGMLDLLVAVGAPKLSSIQGLFGPDSLKNVTIVNIDNKPGNQGYGDIVIVSQNMSSISEQMTEILSELRTPVDNDIAQNLLDGILHATNNFQNPNTSSLAFEMSGILMRQGAVREKGNRFLRAQRIDVQQRPAASQQNYPQGKLQQRQDRKDFDNRRPTKPQHQPRPGFQKPQTHPNSQFQSAPNRPQNQSQPAPQSLPQISGNNENLNPPTDWLTPKVYKGSSNV